MSRRNAFRAMTTAVASGAILFGAGAGASIADASTSHAVKAHAAAATTISVTAVDYKFKLSKTSLSKPGAVTFKITNKGQQPHDFKIDNKTSSMLQPGKSTTLKVTLKKGSFPYLCTVPGHAALGMKGTFKVS
jgi:uncharacterized cupredoxin-like copper-binding protein